MSQIDVTFNETNTFDVDFTSTNAFDVTMSSGNVFDMSLNTSSSMDVAFAEGEEFTADMTTVVTVMPQPYEGEYVVTPLLFQETVLPTTGKTLAQDVTVEEIPYWETSNPSGGTTVYIAMEV